MKSQRRLADAAQGFDVSTSRRSWALPAAFSLALLAVFAVGIFYAYSWMSGGIVDGELPRVSADASPTKVKPAEPGGLDVPHQDIMVLNQTESAANVGPIVERLLPPPEVPQPPATAPDAYIPSADEDTIASLVESEVLTNEGVVPQVAEVPEPAPEAVPETLPEVSVAEAPEAPAVAASEASSAPEPEAAPQVAQAPAATAALAAGSYLLQLAAFTSEGDVSTAWSSFQKSHPDLLGSLSDYVQQAEVNGKTYYRLQVGPFPNKATAVDVCAQLKAKKQDCLVVKR